MKARAGSGPTALDRRGPAKHPDLRVVVASRTIIKNFCSFKPLSLWYFVMAAIRHLILPLKILIMELHCLRFQMFTYSRHCFLMALISGLTQILILTLGHLVQVCRIRAKLVKTNKHVRQIGSIGRYSRALRLAEPHQLCSPLRDYKHSCLYTYRTLHPIAASWKQRNFFPKREQSTSPCSVQFLKCFQK